MKQSTRKALGYAVVPLMSVFAFAPAFADASMMDDSRIKGKSEMRHERMLEGRDYRLMHASTTKGERMNKADHRGMSRMLGDHGKHRGWLNKNPEADVWAKSVFDSIKDSDYTDFKDAVSGTALSTSTSKDTFEKLALASDKIEAGKHDEARTIMNELRDAGYRFKQLFRESLQKLFPKG